MKRRDFGLLTCSGLATAATRRPAFAQSTAPDPTLLTTTLTPLGAERAGNADGSIPPWTGGLTAPPLGANQADAVHLFEDEQPLYTVSAGNMAQYQDMLTEGTKAQMTQYGLTIKVYPTHRTAAAPQYVYDNTAQNVTRTKIADQGIRFGFTGAYAGPPFPIIDTSDPLLAGGQLIWNHLTAWYGFMEYTQMAPGTVVVNGQVILVEGGMAREEYLYYDPNGSAETYGGYFSKGHYYYSAPASANGQETLVWHSTNVNIHPDIVWTLLNGQGRVRKSPNEAYDSPNPESDGICNVDEAQCFYGNPSQYDWKLITKKEMLVPYNCNKMLFGAVQDYLGPHFPSPDIVRWEKHRVWVVEATLHPGERNVNAKRRLYFDEDTWFGMLGEGYDAQGNLVKVYANYNQCVPALPGTIDQGTATFNMTTGDYIFNGNDSFRPYSGAQYITPQPASAFEPEEMSANAAF
jgi:hypothetical protein